MGTIINYNLIGKRIKDARHAKKFTQEKVSELCGITVQHLSNIENGNTKLSLPSIVKIANALDVSVDYLMVDNIENNHPIAMEQVGEFFEDCSTTEVFHYLDILNEIKKLYEGK